MYKVLANVNPIEKCVHRDGVSLKTVDKSWYEADRRQGDRVSHFIHFLRETLARSVAKHDLARQNRTGPVILGGQEMTMTRLAILILALATLLFLLAPSLSWANGCSSSEGPGVSTASRSR